MQSISLEIWDKKYRLKDSYGKPIDKDINDNFIRVATKLASIEESNQEHWTERFLWAMQNGAIPAGRILANVGSEQYKGKVSAINCTVSNTIEDSMEGILQGLKEAGMTLASGAGIGYCFSTLRPKGAYVAGAGAYTSGPLSFMDIYDSMCKTVSSAGGRRGAQMATFDVSHPDIEDFIKSKREAGRFRQFNLSVLITNAFMKAVENDKDWDLHFDGKVYRTVRAKELWDLIMRSTYDYAEPGVIFIDSVNEMNNLWWCEDIRASNPCAEQFLPPYGACLLGSVNLTKFVENPFSDDVCFNWFKFADVVRIFTRMLDNVVELNGLPLKEQRDEIIRKRRHGMGFMGLGSAMTMMCMKYSSPESVTFTENVTKMMAIMGYEVGVELAKEKGMAPIMSEMFNVTTDMKFNRPEMWKASKVFPGRYLVARHSEYMFDMYKDLVEAIEKFGCRFTHHTSIAPTGTISLSIGENCSNGIEPSFAHSYKRNIIVEGKKTKEQVDVYSYEYMLWREMFGDAQLPDYFQTANDISPIDHIKIQAAAQKWVDSSISKTINVPSDYPFEDFKNIYKFAYENGLKGCTTFRYNPEAFQGVLVSEKDLSETIYKFTLDNGSSISLKGTDKVFYDGDQHIVGNLYDAIKEGLYGRY